MTAGRFFLRESCDDAAAEEANRKDEGEHPGGETFRQKD